MGVERRVRDQVVYLEVPSDVNRDLGLFLIFMGVVGSVPALYLVSRLILQDSDWDWRIGGFVGLALVVAGLWLILYTRRRFRLAAGEIRIHDGSFRKPLVYRWKETPAVRVRSVEEERGGKPTEVFEVHLVDGRYSYLLDRRAGEQMESRTLAEMIAKALGCPIHEKTRETGDLVLEATELDHPFVERVKRHPVLLGPQVDAPANSPVTERQEGGARVFSWSAFHREILSEILVAAMLLVGIEMLPFQLDSDGPAMSLWDIALSEGDFSLFYAEAAFLALALLLLSGQRHELWLSPQEICWRRTMWGLTLKQRAIPLQELEQISVRESSRGTFVQLISDKLIISRRLPAPVAAWLASAVRHHYAAPK